MRVFALGLLALCASVTFASTKHFRIAAEIYVDGKLVSTPRVVTNADESAEINSVSENPHQELKLKVVASDDTTKVRDGIRMKFDVEYFDGFKTVKSSPKIVAKPGSESTIYVGNSKLAQGVEMKFVATRE